MGTELGRGQGLVTTLSRPGSELAPILIHADYQGPLPAELVSLPFSPTGKFLWLSQPDIRAQVLRGLCGREPCFSFPAIAHHSATFLCYEWRGFRPLCLCFSLFPGFM